MKEQFSQWLRRNLDSPELLIPFLKGATVALSIQVSAAIVNYLLQLFLARQMGATEYGIYNYLLSICILLGEFAGVGLPNALLRLIPEYKVMAQWQLLKGIIWGSWSLVFICGLLIAGLAIVFILRFQEQRNFKDEQIMLWGLWLVPLWGIIRLQLEMIRANRQIILALIPSLLIYPALIAAGVIILRWHDSSPIAAIEVIKITLLSLLAIGIIQLVLFWQKCPHHWKESHPIYLPKYWLSISLPLLLADGSFVVMNQTDLLMLEAWKGAKSVGIYTAAVKTASWVNFFLTAVNIVAAPMFAALYAQGKRKQLQTLIGNYAAWIFYPSLMVAVGLIILSDKVLGFFGTEFHVAQEETVILILGQLVNVGAGSVGYLMKMTGHQNQCALVFTVTAMVNVGLNALFIPIWGTEGAALVTAFSILIWNIWLHQLVVKEIGLYPSILSVWRARIRGGNN